MDLGLELEFDSVTEFGLGLGLEFDSVTGFDIGLALEVTTALEVGVEIELEFDSVTGFSLGLVEELATAIEFGLGLVLRLNTSDQFDLAVGLEFGSASDINLALDVWVATGTESSSTSGTRAAEKPWTILVCGGQEFPMDNWTLSQEINGGYQWASGLPYSKSILFDEGTIFQVHGADGQGNPLNCPPLVANSPRRRRRDVRTGYSAALSGTDLSSWRMTQPGQSWPTFQNTSSVAIAAAIAGRASVQVLGAPPFPVFEEDIKQSDLWAALLRIAEVAANNVMIDPQGNIRFVPVQWTGSAAEFSAESVEEIIDPSRRVTQIKFSKRLAAASEGEQLYHFDSLGYRIVQLKSPIRGPGVTDHSINGRPVLIGFWAGDPGKGSARLVAFYDQGFNPGGLFTMPLGGGGDGVATHMSLSIAEPAPDFAGGFEIDASVLVTGTPPTLAPSGIDLAFEVTIGEPTRPATSVRTEPLYPSKAYVQGRAQALLWEANKGVRQVEARGPLQYTATLAQVMHFDDFPAARIESISHSHTPDSIETTLKGFAIPW